MEGVGPVTLRAYINFLQENRLAFDEHTHSMQGIFEELSQKKSRIKVPTREAIDAAKMEAEKIIAQSERAGIRMYSFFDTQYPPLLREIKDAPLLLHVKGNIQCLHEPTVAVIGTREPSAHVTKAGERFTRYFVEAGFTIVSGLAVGCDTIGHRTACNAGKPTAAFLAGGLDRIYPKENSRLAEEILEAGGALLSEYEYGRPANRNFFVERDRLQSGASEGLVVLETGVKGGTRHTVSFAEKQKRPIGCLYSHTLPSVNQAHIEKFQGNIDIVKNQGGIPLTDRAAIEQFIGLLRKRRDHRLGEANTKDTESKESEHPPQAPAGNSVAATVDSAAVGTAEEQQSAEEKFLAEQAARQQNFFREEERKKSAFEQDSAKRLAEFEKEQQQRHDDFYKYLGKNLPKTNKTEGPRTITSAQPKLF
jgi:DNA processing protein